jgi:hypothetical protein
MSNFSEPSSSDKFSFKHDIYSAILSWYISASDFIFDKDDYDLRW